MTGLSVDLTVRLGDILTMIGLFAGGIWVVQMQRADAKILAERVSAVENAFGTFSQSVNEKLNGITAILVEQARHDQRIVQLEQEIKDLKRGR